MDYRKQVISCVERRTLSNTLLLRKELGGELINDIYRSHVDKFDVSRAEISGHCTRLHRFAATQSPARGTFPNYFFARPDWGKDSVMFARQLYKQAAITPSSCRKFRTLSFVAPFHREFSRARIPF